MDYLTGVNIPEYLFDKNCSDDKCKNSFDQFEYSCRPIYTINSIILIYMM